MRHIYNYKKFNEAFGEILTDLKSVSTAKQYYNKLELDIKEYDTKKSDLEKLYTDVVIDKDKNVVLRSDDITLKTKVDALIGKTDIQSGKDRSPFFASLLPLLDIKRQIIRKEKAQSADTEALKALKSGQEGSESKEVDPRIKETEEKMSLNNSDISELKKEVIKKQKEFDEMIAKTRIKLNNSVKTISDLSNKIQIGNVVSLKK
jgi:hypothetical protein